MEPAVLALVGLTLTVVGLTLTVMIHLDRSRGKAMQNGFDRLAGALNQLRGEMTAGDDKLRGEMQAGFAVNAAALLELARNVGRVEGRTETLVTSE